MPRVHVHCQSVCVCVGEQLVPRTDGLAFLRPFGSSPLGLKSSSSLSTNTSRPTLGRDEPLERITRRRHFRVPNSQQTSYARLFTYVDPFATLGRGLAGSSAGEENADDVTDEQSPVRSSTDDIWRANEACR